MSLNNKRVLLGISAGIAAYKAPDLVRKLTELGAEVRVVMSKNSEQFVSALALQAVSGHAVHHHAMTADSESGMGHIDLARWADVVLIAPATANMIARLRLGNADELLTTLCVATEAVIALAPAMNQQMWHNPATQDNLQSLADRGLILLGPDSGEQACGEVGLGRMLQPVDIADQLSKSIASANLEIGLTGKSIMITAGPTWEAIDPVRGISNHSSGKMGYAIADAAVEAGAKVTLVSGPTHIPKPDRVEIIDVVSALDMHQAVMAGIAQQDIFIAVAAVADYRPIDSADQKLKKNTDQMMIEMVRNPDILAEVAGMEDSPFCVGFAAETDNLLDYAKGKLEQKNLNLIAANHVGGNETGFGTAENAITLLGPDSVKELPRNRKEELARLLLKEISIHYNNS